MRFFLLMTVGMLGLQAMGASDGADALKRTAWTTYISWGALASTGTGKHHPDAVALNAGQTPLESFRAEIAAARSAGINGFLFDLTMPPPGKPDRFYRLYIMDQLLQAAKGQPFYINPMFDGSSSDVKREAKALIDFYRRYANHPNVMMFGRRMVIFGYHMNRYKPEYWTTLFAECGRQGAEFYSLFEYRCPADQYNPDGPALYATMPEFAGIYNFFQIIEPEKHFRANIAAAKKYGKLVGGSIFSGYQGDPRSWRSDWYWPFFGSRVLLDTVRSIMRQQPDFVHLTTWNDYQETELRPTIFRQDCCLRLIRYMLSCYRGDYPVRSNPTPDLILSFRREILAGEILRLDWINLPSAVPGGKFTAAVSLINAESRQVVATTKPIEIASAEFRNGEWRFDSAALKAQSCPPIVFPEITVCIGDKTEKFALPSVLLRHGRLENTVTQMIDLRNMPHDVSFDWQVEQVAPREIKLNLAFAGKTKLQSCQIMYNDAIIYSLGPEIFSDGRYAVNLTGIALIPQLHSQPLKITVDGGKLGRTSVNFNHLSSAIPEWQLTGNHITAELNPAGYQPWRLEVIGDNQAKVQAQWGGYRGEMSLDQLKAPTAVLELRDSSGTIGARVFTDGEDAFAANRPRLDLLQGRASMIVPLPYPAGSNALVGLYLVYADGSSRVAGPLWLSRDKHPVTVPLFASKEEFDDHFMHFSVNPAVKGSTLASFAIPFRALQYDLFDFNLPAVSNGRVRNTGGNSFDGVAGGINWHESVKEFRPLQLEENGKRFYRFDGKDDYIVTGVNAMFSGAASVAVRFRSHELNRRQVIFCNARQRPGYVPLTLYLDKDGRLKVDRDDPTALLPEAQRNFWRRSTSRTVTVSTPAPLVPNRWYDAAAVYDFKSLKLYLDGKLVGQTPCAPVFYRGNSIMRLGGLPGGNSELPSRMPGHDSFRGDIERVGYYGWPLLDGKVPATSAR